MMMDRENIPLKKDAKLNAEEIKKAFGKSFDLIIRKIYFGTERIYIFLLDGMCDEIKVTETVIKPLTDPRYEDFKDEDINKIIKTRIFKGSLIKTASTVKEAVSEIILGNVVIIADNSTEALCFSLQGFPKKSITEPQSEQNEKGSQEAFTDNFKDNATLLRRKLRTPSLIIEQRTYGKISNTPALLCYMSDRVDSELLNKVNKKLKNVNLDAVLGSGYIKPFIDSERASLFSDTGITERPDTFSAKLLEGRIGIIVDGTPFAIIVPYLLIDYFHTVDDYLSSSYYAFFMRILRILCFAVTTTLPGIFVAVCLFHPEVMPSDVMYGIAAATNKTPFPIMIEALTIHFIYEIVREAGLRMPRSVGHAVTIVGALVIGDAAVTAGLIAAPMLIVVAITAVSASVIDKLHEPVAVLRFALIIAGGLAGLYGVMLGIGLMLFDICSLSPYGIPFSAPLSPFVMKAQRDTVLRLDFRKSGKKDTPVERMRF